MLGIAFQIKDDLLDYQVNNLTGKPAGNDIQEKKLTLPLIHALNQSTHSERDHILHIMNSSAKSKAKFNEVLSFIHKHQGISYAETKMKEFSALAKQKLSIYGTESSRQDLNEFIDYAILRNK
jgi:octaprenyl-diphosphate synthase